MTDYIFNVALHFISHWVPYALGILSVTIIWCMAITRITKRVVKTTRSKEIASEVKEWIKTLGTVAIILTIGFGVFESLTNSSYTYKHDDTYQPNKIEAQVELYQYQMEQGAKSEITLDKALQAEDSESRKARLDKLFDIKKED